MYKKLNKHGFTIVELVIVIAIIAILAAVLIPTFGGVIQQARIASDTQLVRNLNTALATDSAFGNHHPTMQSALDVAQEYGYDVSTIVAKSTNNIVWDSINDRFLLIKASESNNGSYMYIYPTEFSPVAHVFKQTAYAEGEIIDEGIIKAEDCYKYFKVYHNLSDVPAQQQNFSIYAGKGNWACDTFETTVGFDAGINTGIKTIEYKGNAEQSVIICTTNGKLVVDTTKSSVAHHGNAKEIEVKAVANAYQEFGTVQFAEIAGGNFVIEESAIVTALHFDATDGKFVNAEGQKISVDMSKATNIPSFSRDSVAIDETNGTLVAKVKTSEEDYIWLTKAGIIEQTTLSDSATEAKTTYAQKTDANYDIADQIANNAIRGENGRPLKADGETEMTEQEVAELTSASEITIQNPTKETVAEIATQGHLSVEKDTCVAVLDKTIMRTGQNKGGVEDETNTERIKKVLAQCDNFEDIVDKINAGEFDSGFVHARGVKSNDLHGLLISGDIKLTKDLYINPAHALSFRFVIDGNSLGEDKTMTIDLNGHKIVQLCGGQAGGSSGYCLFTVRNDAIINIIDSSFGEAGAIIGNHCVFDIYEGCQINLYRGTLTLNDTIAAYDYAFDNDYTGEGSAVVTLDGVSSINIYGGSITNRTNVKVDPNHLSALIDPKYSPLYTDYVSSSESIYGTWYTYDTGWKTVNSKAIHKFSGSTTINNIGGTIEGPAE